MTKEQRQLALEVLYKNKYWAFVKYGMLICNDIEDSKDAVQQGFLWFLTTKVDLGNEYISDKGLEKIVTFYIKKAIYTMYRKRSMAQKHSEGYKNLYEYQISYAQTPVTEFYPILGKIMKNIKKLNGKEQIIANEYLMYEASREEVCAMIKLKVGSIGNLRKAVIRKLKQADPSAIREDDQRGNETQPETYKIIELRDKNKMMYKDIAKLVNLNVNQVKLRYWYHKQKLIKSL